MSIFWKDKLKNNIHSIDALASKNYINIDESDALSNIIERHPMNITEYYLNLIDNNNSKDPIKKMSIPSIMELDKDGDYDTSGEESNTKMPGLQHKYKQTALVLSTNKCYMYCRYCFRKRMVGYTNNEIMNTMNKSIDYISKHKQINNVLITGGDSLTLSNEIIKKYLDNLSCIEHLDFIRFGTRIPVVFPMRIYEDKELLELFDSYNKKKKIIIVTQFNHPKELSKESLKAIDALRNINIDILNQTVLLKDINDDKNILSSLMRNLTTSGINPYYVFQCRPVKYVKNHFQVPLTKGIDIINDTRSLLNGVSKRFRYVLSHPRGKIEILGVFDNKMLFKFHQSKNSEDENKIFTKPINNNHSWLDENLIPIT
ncbi:MAG: KamA family radical SAM protein [Eubacteriaceae bacterium]